MMRGRAAGAGEAPPPSIIAVLRGTRVNDFMVRSGQAGGGAPGGVAAALAR